jgi:hypothetical protein
MSCETWQRHMSWMGVTRVGPFGRKIMGSCERILGPSEADALVETFAPPSPRDSHPLQYHGQSMSDRP